MTVIVNGAPPVNEPPVVDAGGEQSIVLPTRTVALNGTATDDGLPSNKLTTTWTKVSGRGTVVFGRSTLARTTASFSAAGSYVLRLTATDTALTTFADAIITIYQAEANKPPEVSLTPAAATLTLPEDSLVLEGTIADDGRPAGAGLIVDWTRLSGPAPVAIDPIDPGDPRRVQARFTTPGEYAIRLTASDSELNASAVARVSVLRDPRNREPAVAASGPPAVAMPNAAALAGGVSDDGLPAGRGLTFGWGKVSGPGTVRFAQPDQANLLPRSAQGVGGGGHRRPAPPRGGGQGARWQ